MPDRLILVCNRCHRDALRIVEVEEQRLCPRCALAVIDEAIRTGDVEAIDVQRREQPVARVARMRR